ncbi:MAG: hypothetical protein IKE70_04460 [Bacilli bacterium]|nr:hypothetical protein [Bacilli bacterium]
MGETDLNTAGPVQDAIRSVFTFLDKPAFWLLTIVYQLFFNVATATIVSNDMILKFYNRVQLVLGVYMLFQLALIIIKGIVNPDDFTKSGGSTSKLVVRIITVLLIFATLIPMTGINPSNEFESQIHDNGILFGTLYSLQNRILSNNTLGKLILGTSGDTADYWNQSDNKSEELKKSANMFASAVLRGFYRINLIPDENGSDGKPVRKKGDKPDDRYRENWICQNMSDDVRQEYIKEDADPQTIISMITKTCDIGNWFQKLPIINLFSGTKRYVFAYMPIIPTIVAIVFVFILASFTIDVAVRSIKLAILRLIAPIPLVSYLDPKGSKDGSFNSWVKTLTSTYLDLFIRLAVILFVIFIIQDTIVNGIVIRTADGLLGHISLILIWIALFIFAKQAPNFLKQALGFKGDSKFSLFGGLGEIVGAAGAIGGTALGTVASMRSNRQASRAADEARDAAYEKEYGVNPNRANSLLNRGKHLLAGMAGGVAGLTTGVGAAMSAKDHAGRAAMDAINKRNARVRELGSQGGTFWGGVGASFRHLATGQSAIDNEEARNKKEEEQIKYDKQVNAERKIIMDRASSQGLKSDKTSATIDGWTGDLARYNGFTANAARFNSALEAARSGASYSKYVDSSGTVITEGAYNTLSDIDKARYVKEDSYFQFDGHEIKMSDAGLIQTKINDGNIADYAEKAIARTIDDPTIQNAASRYEQATKKPVETVFGGKDGLKAKYGAENERLSQLERDIADRRNSYRYRRGRANEDRFKNGK